MGVDGTGTAIEVADVNVILMVNDLKQLPKLDGLSHSQQWLFLSKYYFHS